jgi:hypothetical protein
MEAFIKSNVIFGGLSEARIELENSTLIFPFESQETIVIDMGDESEGLMLNVYLQHEDEDEFESESILQISISEEDRAKVSHYLRLIADMIDRRRENLLVPGEIPIDYNKTVML